MKTEVIEFAGYNGTTLPAVIWQPEGQIKAVLQIHFYPMFMEKLIKGSLWL